MYQIWHSKQQNGKNKRQTLLTSTGVIKCENDASINNLSILAKLPNILRVLYQGLVHSWTAIKRMLLSA